MIDRRHLLLGMGFLGMGLLAGALPLLPASARAEELGGRAQPFTSGAFATAQREGKLILIDTYATWCEICARQAPILDKLLHDQRYSGYVVFRVNFDTQKDVMRALNARVQSTLIVFRGNKEIARSVGETQPEWVADLLDKGLTAPGTSEASGPHA